MIIIIIIIIIYYYRPIIQMSFHIYSRWDLIRTVNLIHYEHIGTKTVVCGIGLAIVQLH